MFISAHIRASVGCGFTLSGRIFLPRLPEILRSDLKSDNVNSYLKYKALIQTRNQINESNYIYILRYSNESRWAAKLLSLHETYPVTILASFHDSNILSDK